MSYLVQTASRSVKGYLRSDLSTKVGSTLSTVVNYSLALFSCSIGSRTRTDVYNHQLIAAIIGRLVKYINCLLQEKPFDHPRSFQDRKTCRMLIPEPVRPFVSTQTSYSI